MFFGGASEVVCTSLSLLRSSNRGDGNGDIIWNRADKGFGRDKFQGARSPIPAYRERSAS